MEAHEYLIASFPSLAQYLQSRKWESSFTRATFERSRPYANERYVVKLEFSDLSGTHSASIKSRIYGSSYKPYNSAVYFTAVGAIWMFSGDCTCPVGYNCKHTCALLLYLTEKIIETSKDPEKLHRLAQPRLSQSTELWLTLLNAANPIKIPPKAKSTPYNKFLAYCIESTYYNSPGPLQLVLRVGSTNKSGISIDSGTAQADITKPPKYMTEVDLRLVTIYRRIERKQGAYSGVKLMGEGLEGILEEALAQSRLFYTIPCRHFGPPGFNQVRSGPPELIEASWETLPSGAARPRLKFEKENLVLLPTDPPFYFDSVSYQLGYAESSLPGSMLSAWEKGPIISSSDIPLLLDRLSTLVETPLPLPVALINEVRPAQAPTPHLQIIPEKIGPSFGSTDTIIGIPTFSYGDSPALSPLLSKGLAKHVKISGNTRVTWPRDAKAEAQHLHRLLKSDLTPLSEIFSEQYLTPITRLAVTLPPAIAGQQIEWANFLEGPQAAILRDSGWTLDIDPKAGLTAHDASEFFPAIEADPDHGIDWFRFDMQIEIDGKKLSLIPIIAQIIQNGFPPSDSPDLPEVMAVPCENPEDGFIRFPARRLLEIVEQICHLFHGNTPTDGALRIDRLSAAGVADTLAIDGSETIRALAKLGHSLKNISSMPLAEVPATLHAELRPYQVDGYRWLQFLASHSLHGILADDMGLGKTLQTLAHLTAECAKSPGLPSLVIAPTSVVPNWAAEAEKFTPHLKVLVLQGKDRAANYEEIAAADVVLTSYPLLVRDFEIFSNQKWHLLVLDEAQYIKNPKAITAHSACKLKAAHRLCLSGTPMENHLGELWSLMRFLMPSFLGDEKSFNIQLRRPIERERSADAQLALNRRVSPLILRRTKDQVATDLPAKTTLIHHIDLTRKQTDLYESVRASMDKRVRDAIAAKGLAKSHIIVLDALLKLRQICCHPQLLKTPMAEKIGESAKLSYLTDDLLPTLLEEGRRILLFSQFTSMLALIEAHLKAENIPFLKLTGQTQDRSSLVKQFQSGEVPIFLISLKAGGTGLNLTAADTIIHYDPWWNPAAENQATDRAHRIGQTKPVFVHKLVCRGTIEDRILDLQKHKAALVEALLSEETSKLRIDSETLSHLLAPLAES